MTQTNMCWRCIRKVPTSCTPSWSCHALGSVPMEPSASPSRTTTMQSSWPAQFSIYFLKLQWKSVGLLSLTFQLTDVWLWRCTPAFLQKRHSALILTTRDSAFSWWTSQEQNKGQHPHKQTKDQTDTELEAQVGKCMLSQRAESNHPWRDLEGLHFCTFKNALMLNKRLSRDNVILAPYCVFFYGICIWQAELWDFFYTGPSHSSIVHSMMML